MKLSEAQKRWLDTHPELKSPQERTQRKIGHDYRSRCIYMVTICVEDRRPLLGKLCPPDEKHRVPHVLLSALGQEVLARWNEIPRHHPEVRVMKCQVMPDHLHGVLFVTGKVTYHLSQVVSGFKRSCYQARDERRAKLWQHGYSDTILSGKDQLDHMLRYLADNPRRLWVKRHHGELFTKRSIVIDGNTVNVMGNIHLLYYDRKAYVQCTNKLDAKGVAQVKEHFVAMARDGHVIVTAGISKGEKAVKDWVLDNGLEMILVISDGMSELWKPAGKLFDACADGKLLIVAPGEYRNFPHKITRDRCLALNELAFAIVHGRFTV